MPREDYQRSLGVLRNDIRAMGELALSQLDDSLEAIQLGDDSIGRQVIENDQQLNQLYLDIESDCIDLFALQQPLAGDLRFVAASFKISTDLERVGDLATNLASYAIGMDRDLSPEIDVVRIGTDAREQVSAAIQAYHSEDAAACRKIAARDDEIDAMCLRAGDWIVRDLIEREADTDAWEVERLIDEVSLLLLVMRDLERVGDHAVNIAARTLYLVENDEKLIY